MSEDDQTKVNPQLKMEMKIRPDNAAGPKIDSIELLSCWDKEETQWCGASE